MPGTSGHIHVSIRDKSGRNIFAVSEEEKKAGGREGAAFEDTKYLSQEAEWFLAGLLEGLSDGMSLFSGAILSLLPFRLTVIPSSMSMISSTVSFIIWSFPVKVSRMS
jgi:glutamine synthetase